MADPINFKPSASTVVGAALGVPVGVIVVWLIGLAGIVVPGEVGSAIGTIAGAVLGWFFPGGRSDDVA